MRFYERNERIIKEKSDLPKTYIKTLLKEAYANSLAKLKDTTEMSKGKTIVKSISPIKKRMGVVTGKKKIK